MPASLMAGKQNIEDALRIEKFYSLKEELFSWRLKGLQDTGILSFVKGLRLSALLIYVIRDDLSSYGYEVDWGHLIDPDGNYVSPECDIIIHTPGHVKEWNGNRNPVMNFKFIKCNNAAAVVSCKSLLKAIDEEYYEKMKPYVKNVLLFAECCDPRSIGRLQGNAKTAGYKGFWYLYACDKKMQCAIDEKQWLDFLNTLRKLVDSKSKKVDSW